MDHKPINWDEVPEVITKEQLWKLCHVSKNTARFLLQSGKIPCIYSGGKMRCYKILKKDVITYIANRDVSPEYYAVSEGRYANSSRHRISSTHITEIKEDMHNYFTYLLRKYPDVLGNEMISNVTGYSKTAINDWCKKGYLRHFVIKSKNMIPKIYLIDFFCSAYFRTITRKTAWHRKSLISYPNWKYRKKRDR